MYMVNIMSFFILKLDHQSIHCVHFLCLCLKGQRLLYVLKDDQLDVQKIFVFMI